MSIQIYNSLTAKKEVLKPLKEGQVSMYVCGPTVYDDPHIGHLRSAYVFDIIRTVLERQYQVTFVRNVTDIDDKIIERAKRDGTSVQEIARTYLISYQSDLKRLGCRVPTLEPRATDAIHIDRMKSLIQNLLDKGMAYTSEGSVYFEVRKLNDYGVLSGQNVNQMKENWRQEPGGGKKDSLDFALWKKSRDCDPSWDSPWGKGRPGWHIECTAMSTQYLGSEFDIHGGGKDLIFPHHENERAQAVGASGKRFASIWIHHGLVTTQSRKMSKSLGNFITLDAVLKRHRIDTLKLFFLQSHYSQDVDFTWDKMAALDEALKSFHIFSEKSQGLPESNMDDDAARVRLKEIADHFDEALRDDFNTPKALASLFDALHEGNALLAASKSEARLFAGWIHEAGGSLGLFGEGWTSPQIACSAFGQLIRLRDEKRRNKEFKASDFIRNELIKLGLQIEDSRESSSVFAIQESRSRELETKLEALLKKAKAMK